MSQEKIPVLFDTDIGSDIDDAACLAYLLSEPRCELVGITTVTGEAVERAKLASALCKAAGRDDIPIHSGTENPLLIPLKQKAAPQKEKLVNWPHRESFPENTAIEFMRDVIESRPGEVTLLAVGPLHQCGSALCHLSRDCREAEAVGSDGRCLYQSTDGRSPRVERDWGSPCHCDSV